MIPDRYDPRKVGELFLEDLARHYGSRAHDPEVSRKSLP